MNLKGKVKVMAISLCITMSLPFMSVHKVYAESADELYSKAYTAVITCKTMKTQNYINLARKAINDLKGTKAAWAIGEFSKQTDMVQQGLFEEFMSLLFNKDNSKKTSMTQKEINMAKAMVIDFDTYEGNKQYTSAWSSAIDPYQQVLIEKAYNLLKTAENNLLFSDFQKAQESVEGLLTAKNNPAVYNQGAIFKAELDAIKINSTAKKVKITTSIMKDLNDGKTYLSATLTNNSKYVFYTGNLEYSIKGKVSEKTLTCLDTVPQGQTSSIFKVEVPEDCKIEDISIVNCEIGLIDSKSMFYALSYDFKSSTIISENIFHFDTISNPEYKIEQAPLDLKVKKCDEDSKNYITATFKNNTNYNIVNYTVTLLNKNTNEKEIINCDKLVEKGKISPEFTGVVPFVGEEKNIEILRYDIIGEDSTGNRVLVSYDTRLALYVY